MLCQLYTLLVSAVEYSVASQHIQNNVDYKSVFRGKVDFLFITTSCLDIGLGNTQEASKWSEVERSSDLHKRGIHTSEQYLL